MRRSVLIIALVLGTVATACSSGSSGTSIKAAPAQVDPNATIRIAAGADAWPANGTAAKSTDFAYMLNANVYEPLVYLGSDYTLQPGLATSWALQPDGRTWRFNLRHAVTFTDGHLFTADDVVWTFTAGNSGYNLGSLASYLGPDSVKKVDDYTVDFAASPDQTDLRIPEQLVQPEGAIVGKGTFMDTPPYVGTGPFRVASYKPNQTAVLDRNDGYWGDKAKAKHLQIQFVADPQARLQALQAGQADFLIDLDPAAAQALTANASYKVVKSTGGRENLVFANTTPGRITADQTVREAISFSLDRAGYVTTVLAGGGEVGKAMAPALALGIAATSVTPISHDLGRAEKLLSDAGWVAGSDGIRSKGGQRLSVTLLGNPDVPDAALAAIQANLKDSGIDTKIVKAPDAATRSSLYSNGTGDFDLDLEAYSQDDANPAALAIQRFYSASPNTAAFAPGTAFDALAVKALADPSTAAAQIDAASMMKILESQSYIVDVLAGVDRIYAMGKNVEMGDANPSLPSQLWTGLSLSK